MQKYVCEPCGYEYDPAVGDPDNGIAPGTAFEDIPEDWVCPLCGMGKEVFVPAEQDRNLKESEKIRRKILRSSAYYYLLY